VANGPNIFQTFLVKFNKKRLKNVGPIRHCEPLHAALPFTRCRHCRTPPAHRCPRQQRQRVTEGTAMAPWNGPNKTRGLHMDCMDMFSYPHRRCQPDSGNSAFSVKPRRTVCTTTSRARQQCVSEQTASNRDSFSSGNYDYIGRAPATGGAPFQ